MNGICKSKANRILLVEGKDDCHVVLAVAKHHQLPENFGIYDCGNDAEVLKRLNALIVSSERPNVIGAVLDATGGRWAQLTNIISAHGYTAPPKPDSNGTILAGNDGKPRIGVWIMPGNAEEGMLEDFLIPGIPPGGVEVAKAAVELAKQKQIASFKDVHYSKAVIHTYLAWQDEPGRPLGLSVTARLLSAETPGVISFVGWLRRLFL